MARTETDIANSLRDSLAQINPTLDLKVGPIWDYLLAPIPRELATIEAEAERIKRLFSSDFPAVASLQEILSFATHFGVGPDTGGTATTPVVLYRNSAPQAGREYTIPVGSLVSTIDGTLVYRATETKVMYGDYANTYFNPATNRFELEVYVQAIGPGIVYNVPAGRIRRLVTGALGFDGVEQRVQALGGSEPEDITALADRIIKKFKGLDINSVNGIARLIQEVEPADVRDVHVIRPTDRLEFRRPTIGPALDICVSGMTLRNFQEEYLALEGESSVVLQTASATSISTVSINGVSQTGWKYVPDTSPEYQTSTRARNIVEFNVDDFPTGLSANDIVEVKGVRNFLLDRCQAISGGEEALFKTDILVRSFVDLPIVVGMEVRVKNTLDFDVESTKATIANIVQSLIETDIVPEVLIPDGFREQIRLSVPEVDTIRIFEFRRLKSSIDDVEVIVPLKNQIPRYASAASSLIVRT